MKPPGLTAAEGQWFAVDGGSLLSDMFHTCGNQRVELAVLLFIMIRSPPPFSLSLSLSFYLPIYLSVVLSFSLSWLMVLLYYCTRKPFVNFTTLRPLWY